MKKSDFSTNQTDKRSKHAKLQKSPNREPRTIYPRMSL